MLYNQGKYFSPSSKNSFFFTITETCIYIILNRIIILCFFFTFVLLGTLAATPQKKIVLSKSVNCFDCISVVS